MENNIPGSIASEDLNPFITFKDPALILLAEWFACRKVFIFLLVVCSIC